MVLVGFHIFEPRGHRELAADLVFGNWLSVDPRQPLWMPLVARSE